MSGDDDFEDFLARRKPLFRRPPGDELEPPDDVDRLVLRQAREAIKPSRHMHEIRGPGWGMPLALAATLLIALTIMLNVMVPRKKADGSGADVHQVAQRLDTPGTATTPAGAAAPSPNNSVRATDSAALADTHQPAASPASGAVPGFASEAESSRYVAPPPPVVASVPAKAAPAPEWRRDSQSWLAEIDKLRAQGKSAEADAEMAEYKRQHRAYASSPDR